MQIVRKKYIVSIKFDYSQSINKLLLKLKLKVNKLLIKIKTVRKHFYKLRFHLSNILVLNPFRINFRYINLQ